MQLHPFTVTLDRAAGTAELRRGSWSQRVPISALPDQLQFYRSLWSRKRDQKGRSDLTTPGPWARYYEDAVRALERAIKEAKGP